MNQRHLNMIVLTMSVVMGFAAVSAAETLPATIEVVGQAKMMVPPDTARLSFAVETHARKAQDAVRDNAKRTRQLLQSSQSVLAKPTKGGAGSSLCRRNGSPECRNTHCGG